MSLLKKMKDILFEEEEYTAPIKIKEEKEEPKIVRIEPEKEEFRQPDFVKEESVPKIEPVKPDNSFKFPDFDEDEFVSNVSKPNINVLEFERKKTIEKKTNYGRIEKVETKEYIERKKFKPSPIISPVYGILNQDYKAEDIVNRTDTASNIDIDVVRKKAFEQRPVEKVEEKIVEEISDPVVTFFDDKKEELNSIPKVEESNNYKTIDDLLEEASTEIDLEDTLEIPKMNNLDEIEEELEKLDVKEEKDNKKKLEDTLDNDLFDLIDSMYDDRGEV